MINYYLVYAFVKLLTTPFHSWEAAKQGVIDERGNIIVAKRSRTKDQSKSFGPFEVLVRNIKRILEKSPAGATRLASFAAALYLIKEHNAFCEGNDNILNEDVSNSFDVDLDRLGSFVVETVTSAIIDSQGWISKAAHKKWKENNANQNIFASVR